MKFHIFLSLSTNNKPDNHSHTKCEIVHKNVLLLLNQWALGLVPQKESIERWTNTLLILVFSWGLLAIKKKTETLVLYFKIKNLSFLWPGIWAAFKCSLYFQRQSSSWRRGFFPVSVWWLSHIQQWSRIKPFASEEQPGWKDERWDGLTPVSSRDNRAI